MRVDLLKTRELGQSDANDREIRTMGKKLCKSMCILCCFAAFFTVNALVSYGPGLLLQGSASSQLGTFAVKSQARLKSSELSKAQTDCTALISHTLG